MTTRMKGSWNRYFLFCWRKKKKKIEEFENISRWSSLFNVRAKFSKSTPSAKLQIRSTLFHSLKFVFKPIQRPEFLIRHNDSTRCKEVRGEKRKTKEKEVRKKGRRRKEKERKKTTTTRVVETQRANGRKGEAFAAVESNSKINRAVAQREK